MESTVHDVALVFEGGGMRNSYSAGALTVMLENGLYFDDVYGLSAGATNAIDYVSRDVRRAQASFTATLDGLSFRWWVEPFVDADGFGSILHGGVQVPAGKRLPFDFAACQNNPAQVTLQAIDRDTGETAFFAREDFPTRQALMTRVRASTSYPIVLPPTWVDGHALYDGGIGVGGGIMVPRAMDDGLRRFFVVCTRPRGFRRRGRPNRLYDAFFWRRPRMRAALDTWSRRYNAEARPAGAFGSRGPRLRVLCRGPGGREHGARRGQADRELPSWAATGADGIGSLAVLFGGLVVGGRLACKSGGGWFARRGGSRLSWRRPVCGRERRRGRRRRPLGGVVVPGSRQRTAHDGRSLPTVSNKLNQEFVRSGHPGFCHTTLFGSRLATRPRRFQEPLDSSARGAGHDCKRLLGRDDPSAHGGCLRAKARTDDPVRRCLRAGFLRAEGEGSHVMGEDGWARQQGEEARRFY